MFKLSNKVNFVYLYIKYTVYNFTSILLVYSFIFTVEFTSVANWHICFTQHERSFTQFFV